MPHSSVAVVLALSILGLTAGRGWWRLRRWGHIQLANRTRLIAYSSGLGVLALALTSELQHLQQVLFVAHMVQHELLMMVAAPLIVWANPFPLLLWGIPKAARVAVGSLLAPRSRTRRVLTVLTAPRAAWVMYVGCLWLWHSPALYQAALGHEGVHVVEHITFLLTGLLFWWHVVAVAPRLHRPLAHWVRIGYVLGAMAQNEILGVAIAFANAPLYPHYLTSSSPWGLSVAEDQMLAGAVMWIPGGMMYAVAAILLVGQLLDVEAPVLTSPRNRQASPTGRVG